MNYVRTALIGVVLGLLVVLGIALSGCKNHKTYNNTTIIEDSGTPASMTCTVDRKTVTVYASGKSTDDGNVFTTLTRQGDESNHTFNFYGSAIVDDKLCHPGVYVYVLTDNTGTLVTCTVEVEEFPVVVGCRIDPPPPPPPPCVEKGFRVSDE